jgi:hypothetical protein
MKKVRWIIQNNLIAENDLQAIQKACVDINVEFESILVIPFTEELPEFTIDDAVNIYYGSTTLMNNIYRTLNKPEGLFYDQDKFSMLNYMNIWDKHMLNSDATVTTLDEFSKRDYKNESLWFVRPDADDKSFDGSVMEFEKIKSWTNNITHYDNSNLNGQTRIIAGQPYYIHKEWRNFIVDGKVIESTLYRENFKLKKSNIDIPLDMIKFVTERCKEYTPSKAFAMDIGLCGGDYYIIECGCINSVGFYAANIAKIVKAITDSVLYNENK